MTPESLSALHATAFPGPPRPWSVEEFADLLETPGVALFTRPGPGFLLARRAGPEAEVLTLCVAPGARRRGTARALLNTMEIWAKIQGVEEIFLEVADTNEGALALYTGAGFIARGYRKNYYTAAGREAVSARVLCKALTPAVPAASAPKTD